jgi:hypothetical protein
MIRGDYTHNRRIESRSLRGSTVPLSGRGFAKVGDLINSALGQCLQSHRDREWERSMAHAASDHRNLGVLHQISQDLASVDAEGLGPE